VPDGAPAGYRGQGTVRSAADGAGGARGRRPWGTGLPARCRRRRPLRSGPVQRPGGL